VRVFVHNQWHTVDSQRNCSVGACLKSNRIKCSVFQEAVALDENNGCPDQSAWHCRLVQHGSGINAGLCQAFEYQNLVRLIATTLYKSVAMGVFGSPAFCWFDPLGHCVGRFRSLGFILTTRGATAWPLCWLENLQGCAVIHQADLLIVRHLENQCPGNRRTT